MTKILAFVGMPASGKSEAASVLRQKGITVINMGDVIRKRLYAEDLSQPMPIQAVWALTCVKRKAGMRLQRDVSQDQATNEDFIGIDGVRSVPEVERFKEAFGSDFTLVSVDSPLEIRFSRVLARKRSDDMKDISELKVRTTVNLAGEWAKQWRLQMLLLRTIAPLMISGTGFWHL